MQFQREVVGTVIREIRLERHLSQEVLSGLAGMSRTHLTMIERGTKQPNLETIWRIADALDLPPSKLIRRMEQRIEQNKK